MGTTGSPEQRARPLLCVLGIHRWAWVGRPGSRESYHACRRCRKRRRTSVTDAAVDFYRSGMDEKSQESPRPWRGD